MGLVQGRHRRQPARQVRPAAFPRAPDVQGQQHHSARRVLQDRGAARRQRQRDDQLRFHRLFPDDRQGPAGAGDGDGGGPHGQPRSGRRARLSRARRDPGGAPQPGRQRAVRPAGRAADGRAISAPPLPAAGDRLVPRDRGLHPRGRGRLLSPVLRAQQRDPGRRRRHHRGRAAATRRADLRRDPGAAGRTAPPARRAAAARRAAGRAAPRAGAPAQPDALLPRPELQLGRPRARLCARRPGRDPGRRRHQPAVPRRRGRAGPGRRGRGLLPRLQPRRLELPGLREPAPGHRYGRARARGRPRARPDPRGRRHRGRAGAHAATPAGRGHLCARLAGRGRARVRRGADHGPAGGRRRGLAGAHRRGDRRADPGRRAPCPAARAVGDRRSACRPPSRTGGPSHADHDAGSRRRPPPSRPPLPSRRWSAPAASAPIWRARPRSRSCRWSCTSAAARPATLRARRGWPTWPPACSTRVPAPTTARRSAPSSRTTRSGSRSRPTATGSPASCAR